MTTTDRDAARRQAVLERLRDAVQDGILVLRNAAAELDAHGGFESEALRVRTIAGILDTAEDVPDAVAFVWPAIAQLAERLHEGNAPIEGLDLRQLARTLRFRVVAL